MTKHSYYQVAYYARHGIWRKDRRHFKSSKSYYRPIVINGTHYPSHQAAADALGISLSALSQRIARRGLSNVGNVRNTVRFPLVISGHRYQSRQELIEALNCSKRELKMAFHNLAIHHEKVTFDRLWNLTRFSSVHLPLTIYGKQYWHYRDVIRDYPYLTVQILYQRLENKKSGEDLIKPIRKCHKQIMIQGHKFKMIKDAARFYHQSYSGFWSKYKLYRNGQITEKQLVSKTRRLNG